MSILLPGNEQMLPTPAKGKTRRVTGKLTALYMLKMADLYIQQCASGSSDDLMAFLIFYYNSLKKKRDDVLNNSKDGKFEVSFGLEDVYLLVGQQAQIAINEACEKLQAAARFGMSMIRLFWDDNDNSMSLIKFSKWLPRFTK